jgi:hypothetical protein
MRIRARLQLLEVIASALTPMPSQLIDLGGERKTSTANLRWRLAGGPRAKDAGQIAEDVRRLRTLYGEDR